MSKDHELSNEIEDQIQTCPGADDAAIVRLLDIASKLNERCDGLRADLKVATRGLIQLQDKTIDDLKKQRDAAIAEAVRRGK